MYTAFRWYGEKDPIPLRYIQQIPEMVSVVTSLYDVPVGKLWPMDRLLALKQEVETADLTLDVIESLPVHEDIKIGRPNRDILIDIYCQNIARLGQIGVSVICWLARLPRCGTSASGSRYPAFNTLW
jgi:mannonate dehydratase